MEIQNFKEEDAGKIAELVCREFTEADQAGYSREHLDELIRTHDEGWVLKIAKTANTCVFWKQGEIVGFGAISDLWKEGSVLLLAFCIPGFGGRGILQGIIKALEKDRLFSDAKKIEIPLSFLGNTFYQKLCCEPEAPVKKIVAYPLQGIRAKRA